MKTLIDIATFLTVITFILCIVFLLAAVAVGIIQAIYETFDRAWNGRHPKKTKGDKT